MCEGSWERIKGADRKAQICEERRGGAPKRGQRGGTMERDAQRDDSLKKEDAILLYYLVEGR